MILPPYSGCQPSHITQKFGVNPNTLQSNGHRGTDYAFSGCYGKILVAPDNCEVETIVTDTSFDDEYWDDFRRGYGIVLRSLNDNTRYLYWHCMQVFPVKINQLVTKGQAVAQIGNSGYCMVGGVYVPLTDRKQGKGSHLHYEEWKGVASQRVYYDVTKEIDYSAKIEFDKKTTALQFVTQIFNLIKGRK